MVFLAIYIIGILHSKFNGIADGWIIDLLGPILYISIFVFPILACIIHFILTEKVDDMRETLRRKNKKERRKKERQKNKK